MHTDLVCGRLRVQSRPLVLTDQPGGTGRASVSRQKRVGTGRLTAGCLKNHLRLLVAEAEWMDVNGETEEALEKLTQGMVLDTLDALFGDDDSGSNPTLHFINTAECLTEMLLRLGRTEEASEWADKVYD